LRSRSSGRTLRSSSGNRSCRRSRNQAAAREPRDRHRNDDDERKGEHNRNNQPTKLGPALLYSLALDGIELWRVTGKHSASQNFSDQVSATSRLLVARS